MKELIKLLHMNKQFFLLGLIMSSIFVITSCSKSPEQKAQDIMEAEIKKNLYLPDTYELANIKVDSAFAPYDEPEYIESLKEVLRIGNEINEVEEEKAEAERTLSIFSDSYSSSYSQHEVKEARKKIEEAEKKVDYLKKTAKKIGDKAANIVKRRGDFIGFKAVLSYRAKNNGGQVVMGSSFAIFDKDITQLRYICENDEHESYLQFLEQVKTMQEQASE